MYEGSHEHPEKRSLADRAKRRHTQFVNAETDNAHKRQGIRDTGEFSREAKRGLLRTKVHS